METYRTPKNQRNKNKSKNKKPTTTKLKMGKELKHYYYKGDKYKWPNRT